MKNPAAVALGKLARGVPKNFSAEEIEKRRQRIIALNNRRAKKGVSKCPSKTLRPAEIEAMWTHNRSGATIIIARDFVARCNSALNKRRAKKKRQARISRQT